MARPKLASNGMSIRPVFTVSSWMTFEVTASDRVPGTLNAPGTSFTYYSAFVIRHCAQTLPSRHSLQSASLQPPSDASEPE